MLTLSGRVIPISHQVDEESDRKVFSLSTSPDLPLSMRPGKAFLQLNEEGEMPPGFAHYFRFGSKAQDAGSSPTTELTDAFRYLGDGDVVALGNGRLRSLYRANSTHNSLLLTERCNNYCLMCSQPPKDVDDGWLVAEAMEAIRLMPRGTTSLGLTGGEPTLLGDGFIQLLMHIKHWLPRASVHVLSNGRRFKDRTFTASYADIQHPDLMVGIPVYSADPARHDYVVQAAGAFDETIRGILNLKERGQRVEIRVVLHKQTVGTLPQLAEYIARNLLFVDQVALMGLEMTGFTKANLESLWIDPREYQSELKEAVQILRAAGVHPAIYNLPLCSVDPEVESHYVRSISDWKNEFLDDCAPCTRKHECGGFFSSALQTGVIASVSPF